MMLTNFTLLYNSSIRSILDKLAPFGDVKQYAWRTSPWYDRECYVTKLKTRRLERVYRRHPDPTSKSLWQTQFNHQQILFQKKFTDHWSFKISSSGRNQKTLCCLLTQPESTAATHSPDDFARHFEAKIERILQLTANLNYPSVFSRNVDVPLDTFRLVTADEVAAIIKKSPSRKCSLDPMPTWLLKNACDFMAPLIASMCIASID